jgi:agmatine deiminase
MRDTGPTFVIDGEGGRRGVDWRFNAWGGLEGGLYFPWDRDERVASKVLEIEGVDRYRAPIVLEGGSIHVDGEGTVLTTEECLLNRNRNPERSREEIERALHDYLGAEKVVWLGRGVHNDETDGHVDNLACFVRPGIVLLTWSQDESDPQHEISRDALDRLEAARDSRGERFEVVLVPSPGPIRLTAEEAGGVDAVPGTLPRRPGDRLAASYVNFHLGNTRIVFPLLDQRYDDEAAEILRGCFPDREVVGVPAREILLGGGNIHCITQQVPAV